MHFHYTFIYPKHSFESLSPPYKFQRIGSPKPSIQTTVPLSLSTSHTPTHLISHHSTKNKNLVLPLSQIKATRKMKLVFATLLLIALVCSTALSDADAAAPGTVPNGICGPRCGERCAKAGEKDRCLKYCGICCQQCQCVPSGTFGNKSQCPCYMNKKNSKGEPKCP